MRPVNNFFDVRQYKNELRERFKETRSKISEDKRRLKDEKIRSRVLSLPEYKDCDTLLCYVSVKTEVDTKGIIERAITDGKIVAAPCCAKGSREMDFYKINSLDELRPGTFGVLEPEPEQSRLIRGFSASICVLPGLAFDMAGYRIGYGGGYYDRFLSQKYTGATVGICYSECTLNTIRHGRYDVGCDLLVTDLFLKRMPITAKKPR